MRLQYLCKSSVTAFQTMTQLSALQNELDQLTSKKTDLEMEMQNDAMKLEAVKLQEKLAEVCF